MESKRDPVQSYHKKARNTYDNSTTRPELNLPLCKNEIRPRDLARKSSTQLRLLTSYNCYFKV